MTESDHLNIARRALKIGLGVAPIVAGIDKYFNKLTDWTMYLNPLATRIVPLQPQTFMHIVGVVEVSAGLLVLSRWTKAGAYIVMLWLVCIAINLVTMRMFLDLAVRDVEIALSAFVLAQLCAIHSVQARAQTAR
jgi:uncharacterized membrane protein YphA (DoxX/SURF4 family)